MPNVLSLVKDEATASVELVQRARCGDRSAFAELIDRHERMVLAVAYAITGDANLAGDATQDAFLRAWQAIATLRDDARFNQWLCEIVRRSAIDLNRRRTAQEKASQAARDDRVIDPAAEVDRAELIDRVAEALAALDETSRMVVALRYYEELSSHAIAELLSMTSSAVDMRLSRARAKLKELLGENDHAAARTRV